MVFFTCNGCGSSVKKNQVENHQFKCRNSQQLSCVDCGKDFFGNEYKSHIKCITEDEKYSAKGFVAKPNYNKNERKQTEWVSMVQDLIKNVGNTDEELSNALQRISQYENIPRKKPKFMNFLQSVFGNRVSHKIAEQSWDLISKELENLKAKNVQNGKKANSSEANATSNTNESQKRKNNDENENTTNGIKKQKKEVDDSSKKINDSTKSAEQSVKVKWCTIGKTILRAEADKEISLKKFQKKIIAEYLNRAGSSITADETVEVLWSKCKKKLEKNPKFKIHKERIKLVS